VIRFEAAVVEATTKSRERNANRIRLIGSGGAMAEQLPGVVAVGQLGNRVWSLELGCAGRLVRPVPLPRPAVTTSTDGEKGPLNG